MLPALPLATVYWGGTQITPLRLLLAIAADTALVAYLAWCAKFWGK
jgi:hypothetical protein